MKRWLLAAGPSLPTRRLALHQAAMESCQAELGRRDPVGRHLVTTVRVYDLTPVTADEGLMELLQAAVIPKR